MKAQNGMKECSRCRQVKPVSAFGKAKQFSDGLYVYCKECLAIQHRRPEEQEKQRIANERHRQTDGYKQRAPLHRKKYYENGGKENQKRYVTRNQDKLKPYHKKYAKAWAQTTEGQASLKKARLKYYNKDVEASRARCREQYYVRKQSIEYRINDAISSSIYDALKERKNGRRWEKIVGYTLSDIMQHLESLFIDGMSWDNYGQWHIDHIKPKCTFSVEEIKNCWVLSNLQPLWAEDNMRKHKKLAFGLPL